MCRALVWLPLVSRSYQSLDKTKVYEWTPRGARYDATCGGNQHHLNAQIGTQIVRAAVLFTLIFSASAKPLVPIKGLVNCGEVTRHPTSARIRQSGYGTRANWGRSRSPVEYTILIISARGVEKLGEHPRSSRVVPNTLPCC